MTMPVDRFLRTDRNHRPTRQAASPPGVVRLVAAAMLFAIGGNAAALVHDRLPGDASGVPAALPWIQDDERPSMVSSTGAAIVAPSDMSMQFDACPAE